MTKLFHVSALLAVLAFSAAADVSAWERKRTITTPRGTATSTGTGTCSGATCQRDATRTSPVGRTFTRNGAASCADGSCSGTRTTTGPAGEKVTRSRTISR